MILIFLRYLIFFQQGYEYDTEDEDYYDDNDLLRYIVESELDPPLPQLDASCMEEMVETNYEVSGLKIKQKKKRL